MNKGLLRLSLLQGRGRNAGIDVPEGIASNLDSSAYVPQAETFVWRTF